MYKGHNKAIIGFQTGEHTGYDNAKQVDEVSNYLEARYISTCEACYRIFSFKLHANVSYIMRLALHLESQQSVVFTDHSDMQNILSLEKPNILEKVYDSNSFP